MSELRKLDEGAQVAHIESDFYLQPNVSNEEVRNKLRNVLDKNVHEICMDCIYADFDFQKDRLNDRLVDRYSIVAKCAHTHHVL